MASTSATSSAGSGTISSLGVGSGLDASTIVSKLVELERQPITQLQSQADKIQAKISAFGQVQSSVSTFRDAVRKLANPDIWASTVATSSDSTAVSFSTSSGAATGNYSVSVSSLAASQSVVTNTALSKSTDTVGSGTLTIELGTWADGTFTAQSSGSPKTITVAAGDSLEKIRDKINDSISGVSASIVNDASGARLVMTSSATGAANGFRITATDAGDGNDTDNAGLSALAYDPANATDGTKLTQAAANAAAKINGVDVTSSTNKFSDVLTGISFTVGKTTKVNGTDQPVSVAVAQDNDSITKAITDFATSYSSLATLLKDDTKYDDATKTAGPLQGDGTALSILNQFRAAVGAGSQASSVFTTLSSIGVEIQTGGTLQVNSKKLTNALGKLSEVKKLFAYADTTSSGKDGIATKLRTLADNMLGFGGALDTRTSGLKKSIQNNQKRQDELDARATLYEKRLRAQYTTLDETMSHISGTSNYVTQMINSWNKS